MDEVTIIDGKIFDCKQCGECCRHLYLVPGMEAFDLGNGVCKHLNNNRCAIYNHRPNLCRGEYIYHKCYEGMDVDDYYRLLHKYCEIIRRRALECRKII